MAKRRNIYSHKIDLKNLVVKNASSRAFAKAIEKIPYRGYKVEDIADGRKIVIVKPGGKQSFGRFKREDFFVFIYNPKDKTLWQISHKQIRTYLDDLSQTDPKKALRLLQAFRKVYHGQDPDDVLKLKKYRSSLNGDPEAFLKAYKWIWGQEDVNYPTGQGRKMSWLGLEKKNEKWVESGKGMKNLLNDLLKRVRVKHKS